MNISLTPTRVLFAGICSLILTVGISRFAYTPMLPIMQAQTWLTDVAGGWLATFNYLGYMSGALLATSITDLRTKFAIYRAALWVAVLSTLAMGLTENAVAWAALRFVGGFSSTAGLLLASGLVLNWLTRNGHRPELGVHFAGLGIGIILSGLAVLGGARLLDWAGLWWMLAALGAAFLIPAWAWMPAPAAVGTKTAAGGGPAASRRWIYLLQGAYFCAGVGFVVSATFTVAMVDRVPELAGMGKSTWLLVGLAAAPASFAFDRMARRLGVMESLLLAYALQIVSILLPALSNSPAAALASSALYGATVVGIVSLTLTLIGRRFPANPAKAMARLTLSYGVAQIIAPAVSGYIAQATGSYRGALYMAALTMLVGAALLVALMKTDRREAA